MAMRLLFTERFYIYGFNRNGGITAQRTAVKEHFFRSGKVAGRTADRSEMATAIWAGFYLMTNFITAIITKKTGGFVHF